MSDGGLTPEEQEAFERIQVNTMGIRGALGLTPEFPAIDHQMVAAIAMSLRQALHNLDHGTMAEVDFVEDPDEKTIMVLGFLDKRVADIFKTLLAILEVTGWEHFEAMFARIFERLGLDKSGDRLQDPPDASS